MLFFSSIHSCRFEIEKLFEAAAKKTHNNRLLVVLTWCGWRAIYFAMALPFLSHTNHNPSKNGLKSIQIIEILILFTLSAIAFTSFFFFLFHCVLLGFFCFVSLSPPSSPLLLLFSAQLTYLDTNNLPTREATLHTCLKSIIFVRMIFVFNKIFYWNGFVFTSSPQRMNLIKNNNNILSDWMQIHDFDSAMRIPTAISLLIFLFVVIYLSKEFHASQSSFIQISFSPTCTNKKSHQKHKINTDIFWFLSLERIINADKAHRLTKNHQLNNKSNRFLSP